MKEAKVRTLHFKHQEEVYKKFINDQLEFEYKKKSWRPPGQGDTSSESEAEVKTVSASVVKYNDGLGNTNMTMCLS